MRRREIKCGNVFIDNGNTKQIYNTIGGCKNIVLNLIFKSTEVPCRPIVLRLPREVTFFTFDRH